MPLARIGVSSGDAAGIGPELMLRLLREQSVLERCTPIVFADAAVLARVAGACNLPGPETVVPLPRWRREPITDRPLVVDCAALDADAVDAGHVDPACGRAAYCYIEECTRAVMEGIT